MQKIKFIVPQNSENMRIDKFLSQELPERTRSYIQKIVEESGVVVNGSVVKSNYKIKADDIIEMEIPAVKPLELKAEEIKLDIVFEDDDLLVVNKPQGMVVHPAPGNLSGTLVNALLSHCGENLSGINGIARPGILHRIDKDTSGLLLVAKTDYAHNFLSEQIKAHNVQRQYIALLCGNLKTEKGTVNAPIGRSSKDRKKMAITYTNSRHAVTHYEVMDRYKGFTLVKCTLETGRTHQIRVHMASLGHGVAGDKVYGPKSSGVKAEGQLLHAYKLGFVHPRTLETMVFESMLPEYFEKILKNLEKQ